MYYPALADNPLRTRADLQQALQDLWKPFRPHLVRDGAAVSIGDTGAHYGRQAKAVETFARPLWALGPLAAGGGAFADWPVIRAALIEGTDPAHPHYWGEPGEVDQRLVEMAALATALLHARRELWEPLTTAQRANVLAWLAWINRRNVADNNWRFFRVLVNDAFAALGGRVDADRLATDLARLDEFYIGDGWYVDGTSGNRDYYGPMALHYYGLLHGRLSDGGDQTHATRYAERARLFGPQFSAWFARNGAALPYGRSLTYRFAEGAFWGACAYAGLPVLPWGEMKFIFNQHLRWWFRQPIFSETGLLTIGYRYPNLIVADNYNAPGSPYWALKAFLPLALPDTHPFWRAEETAPEPPAVSPQPRARQVLLRDTARDHVFSLNGNGTPDWNPRFATEKYAKFAYSTAFAFGVPAGGNTPADGGADSTLLLSDDGTDWRTRTRVTEPVFTGAVIHSRWSPWPDIAVDTWLIPALPGHLRVHRLVTPRPLRSFEGGFALDRNRDNVPPRAEAPRCEFAFADAYSAIQALDGQRQARPTSCPPNSHLMHTWPAVPGLAADHPAGTHWLVCAVVALPGADQAAVGRAWLDSLTCALPASGPVLKLAGTTVFTAP